MADFNITYSKWIQPNEGYFANLVGDSGGVTYGGIARNLHPEWKGWPIVDAYIASKGGLSKMKNNERIPAADPLVTEYFHDDWNTFKIGGIDSQDVANILYDFMVNSGSKLGVKKIQRIIGVLDDGVMGPNTLAAINKAEPKKLNNDLKKMREDFYLSIQDKGQNRNFIKQWLARLAKFPTL